MLWIGAKSLKELWWPASIGIDSNLLNGVIATGGQPPACSVDQDNRGRCQLQVTTGSHSKKRKQPGDRAGILTDENDSEWLRNCEPAS